MLIKKVIDCARENCQKKRKKLKLTVKTPYHLYKFPIRISRIHLLLKSKFHFSLFLLLCSEWYTKQIQILINIQYPKIFPLVSDDQILDSHFTKDAFLILLVPKNFAYLLSSLFFFNLSISLTQLERLLFTGKIQSGTFLNNCLLRGVLQKSVYRSKLYVHV